MPFIKSAVGDAAEPEIVPEGKYELRLGEAKEWLGKTSGKQSILATVYVENPPEGMTMVQSIGHFLPLTHEDDTPEAASFKSLLQRRFLEAFSIPFEDGGFDTDDFAGSTAELMVKQSTGDDDVTRNVLVLPPLSEEKEEKPKKGRTKKKR